MRIVTGSLRGRPIPFNTRGQGDIRLTPSALKEAVFGMLGAHLAGFSFLDLCAGSGQMGLEAYSRGATVHMNEPDRRRHRQIGALMDQWRLAGPVLHQCKAQQLIPILDEEGLRFDAIYLDPPYHHIWRRAPLVVGLLEELGRHNLLAADGRLYIQHQGQLALPVQTDALILDQNRAYGRTTLSVFRAVEAA